VRTQRCQPLPGPKSRGRRPGARTQRCQPLPGPKSRGRRPGASHFPDPKACRTQRCQPLPGPKGRAAGEVPATSRTQKPGAAGEVPATSRTQKRGGRRRGASHFPATSVPATSRTKGASHFPAPGGGRCAGRGGAGFRGGGCFGARLWGGVGERICAVGGSYFDPPARCARGRARLQPPVMTGPGPTLLLFSQGGPPCQKHAG
jgi:hypothetical protein